MGTIFHDLFDRISIVCVGTCVKLLQHPYSQSFVTQISSLSEESINITLTGYNYSTYGRYWENLLLPFSLVLAVEQ